MKDLIFINSHPIQYFAPLYKYLNEHGVKTKAWYCSDESIKGGLDKQFGVNVKWDIPLLEGYEYKYFKNHSWKPSHFNGFFGLINLGMVAQLFRIPKSVIVVHGWHFCTHFLILLLGKLKGHTICFRYEMPKNQEVLKHGIKQSIKKIFLKHIVFSRVDYFLYIGTQNRLLYKDYGIKDSQLIFCPYSVDNQRFRNEEERLAESRQLIRQKIGIPSSDKVILFSGKYIGKKRPMDVLQAFSHLNQANCWLIMVGDGELRKEMETFIQEKQLSRVILTGFVNQSAIAEYYSISDVFVMSSEIGETWGLSVNEAMNFNLPVIISDLTGSSCDLVKEGDNGYVYKTGDVSRLSEYLKNVLLEKKLAWHSSSETIINNFSYSTILNSLKQIVS